MDNKSISIDELLILAKVFNFNTLLTNSKVIDNIIKYNIIPKEIYNSSSWKELLNENHDIKTMYKSDNDDECYGLCKGNKDICILKLPSEWKWINDNHVIKLLKTLIANSKFFS